MRKHAHMHAARTHQHQMHRLIQPPTWPRLGTITMHAPATAHPEQGQRYQAGHWRSSRDWVSATQMTLNCITS